MSAKIEFIYFDLAGVQYDFRDVMSEFINQQGMSYEEFAKKVGSIEEKANKGEISLDELRVVYNNVLDLQMKSTDQYIDTWTDLFKPITPVHNLVHTLAKTYQIGLLTNIHEGLLQKLFEKKLIVDAQYTSIVQSFEIHHAKPEKEIFLYAQEKAQVDPDKILFIDDNPEYVNTAKQLRWQGVVFDEKDINNALKVIASYFK